MNFKILVVSLAYAVTLSAAMYPPYVSLSSMTSLDMHMYITQLSSAPGADISEIFKKLASETEDCSNLLLSALNSRGVSEEVFHGLVSKSSNEKNVLKAVSDGLSSGRYDLIYPIWRKFPHLVALASTVDFVKDQFIEFANKMDKAEKMFDLWIGLGQEESALHRVPSDILRDHIFPNLQ